MLDATFNTSFNTPYNTPQRRAAQGLLGANHAMPEWQKLGQQLQPSALEGLTTVQSEIALLDVRVNRADLGVQQAVQSVLGMALPLTPCTTVTSGDKRIVWAGPDHWYVLAPTGQQVALELALREAIAAAQTASARPHFSITDISGGYFQVELGGRLKDAVLLQGMPFDLHPSHFKPGMAVGTHFFKVGTVLWHSDPADAMAGYTLLVRRSFINHFWLLIDHCRRSAVFV